MDSTVIVSGARTGMGRLLGALSGFSAAELGGVAIAGALAKAQVAGDSIDYAIMGHVLQAGGGQMTARQAARLGGLPISVPAVSVNKVCLSGINAIMQADHLIRLGEAKTIVAGGMESMTNAPHVLIGSRTGVKYGDWTMKDTMAFDGLFCAIDALPMGEATERYNSRYDLTREDQDAFSVLSHQRAAAALASGRLADEIVPISISGRKGELTEFATDEGVRADTTLESLGRLRPAFAKEGTVTAGNASQISDGAAALVLMSKSAAQAAGISWLAEVVSTGMVAGPDASLHEQPANAIKVAAERAGLNAGELDLYEINEAFAAVSVVSMRKLGVTEDRVNVNGGAVAMGHPIGMSGARIVLHLANELRRRGGGVGAAALCGGSGQGDAVILRVGSA